MVDLFDQLTGGFVEPVSARHFPISVSACPRPVRYVWPRQLDLNGGDRAMKETVVISVRAEGVGLPATFDLQSGGRLGMRLVDAFARQLQGKLQVLRDTGTEFVLALPLTQRS
jgi:two-component sensor histidine kinase